MKGHFIEKLFWSIVILIKSRFNEKQFKWKVVELIITLNFGVKDPQNSKSNRSDFCNEYKKLGFETWTYCRYFMRFKPPPTRQYALYIECP